MKKQTKQKIRKIRTAAGLVSLFFLLGVFLLGCKAVVKEGAEPENYQYILSDSFKETGETRTLHLRDLSFESTLVNLSTDGGKVSAVFKVNGEEFSLEVGQSRVLKDGSKFGFARHTTEDITTPLLAGYVINVLKKPEVDFEDCLAEGVEVERQVRGADYEVKVKNLNVEKQSGGWEKGEVVFEINKEETPVLERGENFVLRDGTKLEVLDLVHQDFGKYCPGVHYGLSLGSPYMEMPAEEDYLYQIEGEWGEMGENKTNLLRDKGYWLIRKGAEGLFFVNGEEFKLSPGQAYRLKDGSVLAYPKEGSYKIFARKKQAVDFYEQLTEGQEVTRIIEGKEFKVKFTKAELERMEYNWERGGVWMEINGQGLAGMGAGNSLKLASGDIFWVMDLISGDFTPDGKPAVVYGIMLGVKAKTG